MSTIKSSGENLKLSSDNTKDIELQHNGSTKVTVKSDGKVGVGTSSPSTTLHVNGRITTNDVAFNHVGTGDLDNTGYAYYSFQNTSTVEPERGWLGFGSSDGSLGVWNNANKPLKFATNNVERMRIDSAGRVTMPYQPAFRAYTPASTSAGSTIVFGSTDPAFGTAQRSGYNTATGKFTAPVSGVYQFNMAVLMNPGTVRIYFTKNGVASASYGDTLSGGSSGYANCSMSLTIYLYANETVACQVSNGSTYGTSYGAFSGHLVG